MKIKSLLLLSCLLLPVQFAVAEDTDSAAASSPAANEGSFSGKVVNATNTAGYTYVQVDTGSKKLWAVTTQFDVKVGDSVAVSRGMPMDNYHSKTLNRDFDRVYFTSGIAVNGAETTPTLPAGHPAISGDGGQTLPPGHPSLTAPAAAPNLDLTGIKKAEGGKTIKEIYAAKAKLAGKTVSVRGKLEVQRDDPRKKLAAC
jgi:hypothetical protein